MNMQQEFDEPASPLCRPMKFRANQIENTLKNSQEAHANPSLSKHCQHPHKCRLEHDRCPGHKQSVLSFLKDHNKGKLRAIQAVY